MGKAEAQAYYDAIGGETTGYISPQDAKDAIGLIYDELADKAVVGNLYTDSQASASATTGVSFGGGTLAVSNGTFVLTATGATTSVAYIKRQITTLTGPKTFNATVDIVSSARAARLMIICYASDGTSVLASFSDPVTGSTAALTRSVSFIAPTGTTYISAYPAATSNSGTGGDTCVWKNWGLWAGAGGDWAMPGTPITNLGTKVTHPNTDDVLVQRWDSVLGRWQTVHYDSGWRNLWGAGRPSGWADGNVHIRRVNSTVTIWADYIATSGTWTSADNINSVVVVGNGFKMHSNYAGASFPQRNNSTGATAFWAWAPTSVGWRVAYGIVAGNAVGGNFSYSTDDPIPTSLPGTLVSAAPA